MPVLTAGRWLLASLCSLLVGISKTGIPGLGTLSVPLFAQVLPAKVSTGALLPLLIIGDVFAVAFYRRHTVWSHLVRLLPWAGIGIFLGFLAMGRLDDRQLKPVLGALVILMLAINLWRSSFRKDAPIPTARWFAALVGLLAGATSMVMNAAGPIMAVYLIAMRLPKNEFIGTSAWLFLILNCVKIPFSAGLGLIGVDSLLFDAALAGGVVAGAFLGVMLAKRIPEKAFEIAVYAITFCAALLLFF